MATEIRTLEELDDMRNNPEEDYILQNDIDASETEDWNDGKGWEPIREFEGSLDGNGYTISNLTIDRQDEDEVGIFGRFYNFEKVTIKNLNLEGFNIRAQGAAGGLVGDVVNTDSDKEGKVIIQSCSADIDIEGQFVGGLIGTSDSKVVVYDTEVNADITTKLLDYFGDIAAGGVFAEAEGGVVIGCDVTATHAHIPDEDNQDDGEYPVKSAGLAGSRSENIVVKDTTVDYTADIDSRLIDDMGGVFTDGQEFRLHNLDVTADLSGPADHAGLVGTECQNVKAGKINAEGVIKGAGTPIGGVGGLFSEAEHLTGRNIEIDLETVDCSHEVGGITAELESSSLHNCRSKLDFTGSVGTSLLLGGCFGALHGGEDIRKCHADLYVDADFDDAGTIDVEVGGVAANADSLDEDGYRQHHSELSADVDINMDVSGADDVGGFHFGGVIGFINHDNEVDEDIDEYYELEDLRATGSIVTKTANDVVKMGGLIGEARMIDLKRGFCAVVIDSDSDTDNTGEIFGKIGEYDYYIEDVYVTNYENEDLDHTGSGDLDSAETLTTAGSTGNEARLNMHGFDWDNIWETVGDGEDEDYPVLQTSIKKQIESADDLKAIEEAPTANYTLNSDIDLSNYSSGSGDGLGPICSSNNPFRGTFDGDGHEIKGLTVDKEDESVLAGLFSKVEAGYISDVTMIDADISSGGESGVIAGQLESTSLWNVKVEDSTVRSSSDAGIISGLMTSDIDFCGAERFGAESCEVETYGESNVGGLVGHAKGSSDAWSPTHRIASSFFMGDVIASSSSTGAGGIFGKANSASIKWTHCNGTIDISAGDNDEFHVGGMVGGEGSDVSIDQGVVFMSLEGSSSNAYSPVTSEGDSQDSDYNNSYALNDAGFEVVGVTGYTEVEMTGAESIDNFSGLSVDSIWTYSDDGPLLVWYWGVINVLSAGQSYVHMSGSIRHSGSNGLGASLGSGKNGIDLN